MKPISFHFHSYQAFSLVFQVLKIIGNQNGLNQIFDYKVRIAVSFSQRIATLSTISLL